MIQLCIKDYCDAGCCNFEPKVETTYYWDIGTQKAMTVITCENAQICENIRKYIDKKKEN